MADRRSKKDAAPQEPADTTESEPAEAEPAPEAEPAAEAEPEPGFENRAARRARGKGKPQPKAAGKINPHGNRGPVQSQRSWANRRSG